MPKDHKRKRESSDQKSRKSPKVDTEENPVDIDTSKPTAVFKPTGPRSHTLSIALPGSVIANAKSHDQKTYLAGQIGRALAVFCVDEIVIFDDEDAAAQKSRRVVGDNDYTAFSHPNHFLAHILSFLETPPHLRKTLFPMHPNLRTAGTLPSLDMPHHLRANEFCEYREGVTLAPSAGTQGSLVDVGLAEPWSVEDQDIPPGTRVTLRLDSSDSTAASAVSPSTPREESGYYWGYTVRSCDSLSNVFTECPFDGGYDISFGTSERGTSLEDTMGQFGLVGPDAPNFEHVLVVFGGVAGLETAARNDSALQQMRINGNNVSELFDHWINVLPGQGSRTIRTEEAVWLGLMGLKPFVNSLGNKV
ncbi:hypothetical protein PV10_08870 [Exophiala mesophila]|uniref:Deoxyribose-phosphate aldolase n=1 Tax=Exophiala mesophila TaxID=212818 RepID=A0A0D1Z3E9_EXOME|nr:uncharacterized protein PV10_08870 [Exophiala mesophila]KIV89292.1 hypothetical protein PV10_08870 [Exophiala mesophila]